MSIVHFIIYLTLAPLAGGLLSWFDRKVTARMQGRVGPPVLQPFYDVLKLLGKENIVVRRSQNFYIIFYFIAVILAGALFFAGENILLIIFALTLADIFLVLGAFKASSPYSFVGAQRELIQMAAYEPIFIFSAICLDLVVGSFYVSDIVVFKGAAASRMPAAIIAFIFALVIKFRKSPFDLSTSHHAHQELVKGLTTEFTGRTLALIEIAHWLEMIIMLGFLFLFFADDYLAGGAITFLIFLFVIFIDNTFARARWQAMLKISWVTATILCLGNIFVIFYFFM